jgi:GTP pyrophosphokinase
MGFRKAEEFYVALGGGKISAKTVTNKVMQRLKQGEAAVEEPSGAEALLPTRQTPQTKATRSSSQYGIKVKGIEDVPLRLAKCCRPVSGDAIVGYVSLGRGITIHRSDCPNAIALGKDPERFVDVSWDGENETSFRVELQVDGWDRHRMLEDLSRCFSEAGINILEARCTVAHPMVRNRFVVEVPEAQTLKNVVGRLRQIESVFDAYRVTPTGG